MSKSKIESMKFSKIIAKLCGIQRRGDRKPPMIQPAFAQKFGSLTRIIIAIGLKK